MNCKFCLLVIILVFVLTSGACSSINEDKSANAEEVIFEDGYKTSSGNEIIIDDNDFGNQKTAVWTPDNNSQETTKTAFDNSKISTTFDRYGNKTEKRTFNYNPRLAFIIFRTSPEGIKQVFIYGQNGDVKSLPENMLDKVLTASADEIANSAGIYNTVTKSPSFAQNSQQLNVTTLKPLPSSQFPIQNQQVEQSLPEEIESPADTTGKTAPTDNNSQPPEKRETVASTKKPDEQ